MRKLLVLILALLISLTAWVNIEVKSIDDTKAEKVIEKVENYIVYQKWWYPLSSIPDLNTSDIENYEFNLFKSKKDNNVFGVEFTDFDYFLKVNLSSEPSVYVSEFIKNDYEYYKNFTLTNIPQKLTFNYTKTEKKVFNKVLQILKKELDDDLWNNSRIYLLDFELNDSMIFLYIYLDNGEIYFKSYGFEFNDDDLLVFGGNGFKLDNLSENEKMFMERVKKDSLSIIDYRQGHDFTIIQSGID